MKRYGQAGQRQAERQAESSRAQFYSARHAASARYLPERWLPECWLPEHWLPERQLAGGRLAEARTTRLAQRRPCAVVVDRDPEVLSALANCLSPELDVQVAGSALRAEAVLAQIAHVDLAFIELELPAALGEELLQHLGRWPDAIRVLLAKHAVAHRDLPRNRYLAHLVLSKPVSLRVVQALKRATLGLPRD
jgi:CheY-like chemotaxis protein